ncbi:MAG: hypothetical protein NTX44_11005 [Ignavibacteriales bacterium]|nr:hypothetical protein [Ignavibacteriales bacterium]
MPSVRSIAYLNVFQELGVWPSEVVIIPVGIPGLDKLMEEDKLFRYSDAFFRIDPDLINSIEHTGATVIKAKSSDINDEEIQACLHQCSNKYFLFTGGGILSEHMFMLGKTFIHLHPGSIPEYRGSTCFYYSILTENTLGSTAIIMDKNIDTGPNIAASKFCINYLIKPEQPLFVDYIIDPYIRSYTLKKVLQKYSAENRIEICPSQHKEGNAYFIMHPLLRHLAVIRINTLYDPNKPSGIFEINQ